MNITPIFYNFPKLNLINKNKQPNIFLKKNECDSVSFTGVKRNSKDNTPLSYECVSETTYKNGVEIPKSAVKTLNEMSHKANKIIVMANKVNKEAEKYKKLVLDKFNNNDSAEENGIDVEITKNVEYEKKHARKPSYDYSELGSGTEVKITVPKMNFTIRGLVDEETKKVEWVTTSKPEIQPSSDGNSAGSKIFTQYSFKDNGQLDEYKKTKMEKEGGDYTPVGDSVEMNFLANQIQYKKEENGKKVQIAELLLEDGGFLRNASIEDNEGSMRKRTVVEDEGKLFSRVEINGKSCLDIVLRDENFQEDVNAVPVEPKYSPNLSNKEFQCQRGRFYW